MTSEKLFMASFRRSCLPAFLAPGVAAAGLVGVGRLVWWWTNPLAAKPFSPEVWATAREEERATMAKGAIRQLPAGTPEVEVVKLLGKPGTVYPVDELFGGAPGHPLPLFGGSPPPGAVRTYSYWLGAWSSRYYDSTFLWVHLDEEGEWSKP